jgi:bifunctional oligoribonuclease and PAP phosphatase NrnA
MTEATELVGSELDLVAEEIRAGDRFLLTTHENPDGDALGSLLAVHRILETLGKDSLMFLAAKEFPLPVEYRFLPLEEVFHEPPADISDRVVIFLDCGNIDRMPVDFLAEGRNKVINIDHHHDNTRFGTINLIDVEASCTAEIVYDLAGLLGVEMTPEIANALYVALVTDTGKFMYENTDGRSHRMAAGLIDAGVQVNEVYRRLYEHAPIEKLKLHARALEKIELLDDGRLAVTYISGDDYTSTGASEALTEGVIDHLRTVDGTVVAAVVRDQSDGGRAARKVSMRSTDGRVDVSAIARVHGGGGHRRAAGFGTDLPYEQVVEFLIGEIAAQLGGSTTSG